MLTRASYRRWRATWLAPIVLAGLLLAPAAAAGQGTPAASPAAVGSPAAASLPDTSVGRRLGWLLDQLSSGAKNLTVAAVKAHFSPQFLAAVSPETLIATLQRLAVQTGAMTFIGFEGEPTDSQAVALVATTSGPLLRVQIAVDPTEPNLIEELLFQPVNTPTPGTPVAARSWADIDRQLAALAPVAEVYAAEIVNGQCQTVRALNASDEIALGSSFKLYVLGDLAHQIAQGKAAWDEELAINDAWKSLPSGNMRNEPAGAKFTLQQYAEQMIAASDDTATDHLIHRLGGENIEAFQTTMGRSHSVLNEPFLTTKELFTLKLALPPAKVAAYIAAPTAEKRQLLATEVDRTPVTLQEAAGWTAPRYIETLEWFASGQDLCRAMARLHAMSARPGLAPIQTILSINPGVPLDKKTWTYVGYKGGSEPGVLTLNWLLQRADGRWFMLSVGLNDSSQDVNESSTIAVAEQALGLLAQPK